MKRKRGRVLPQAQINVTPFIDILLVLLVIFMTISPSMPEGYKATIPQQSPDPDQKNETALLLSVDRTGVIRINQTEIGASDLIGQLQGIFKTRNDRTIFVQADDELLFNDVAQLIAAAKGAGADRIGLMTESITSQ